jgi:hypothetical protein
VATEIRRENKKKFGVGPVRKSTAANDVVVSDGIAITAQNSLKTGVFGCDKKIIF